MSRAKVLPSRMRLLSAAECKLGVISGEPVPMGGSGEKHIKISAGF